MLLHMHKHYARSMTQLQNMYAFLQQSESQYYDPAPFCAVAGYRGEPVDVRQQQDATEFLFRLFESIDCTCALHFNTVSTLPTTTLNLTTHLHTCFNNDVLVVMNSDNGRYTITRSVIQAVWWNPTSAIRRWTKRLSSIPFRKPKLVLLLASTCAGYGNIRARVNSVSCCGKC